MQLPQRPTPLPSSPKGRPHRFSKDAPSPLGKAALQSALRPAEGEDDEYQAKGVASNRNAKDLSEATADEDAAVVTSAPVSHSAWPALNLDYVQGPKWPDHLEGAESIEPLTARAGVRAMDGSSDAGAFAAQVAALGTSCTVLSPELDAANVLRLVAEHLAPLAGTSQAPDSA